MSGCWKKPADAKYHGLFNHGAMDYLNSVLQVLFMTEEFREAVIRSTSPSEEYIDQRLKGLFEELLKGTADPDHILRALGVTKVHEQQDAAEYFERILRKTSENAAQIFHGQLNHRTSCLNCGEGIDSEGPFWHLPLDLEDSSGGNYSVENGIQMFFRPTIFDGDNQMYCDKCDDKVDANREYVITHHPDVLLLMLKRFDFSYQYMSYIKINRIADVPHTLKIPENQTYELYAVVDHSGDLRGGHYQAVIKDEGDKWFVFNDSSVKQLSGNPFPDNVNVAQSHSAYLLFYMRKDAGTEEMMQSSNPDPKCVHAESNIHAGPNNCQLHDNTAQGVIKHESCHIKLEVNVKQENDGDICSIEHKARDHVMVEQTVSKENQPDTQGFRLDQSEKPAVHAVPNIPDDMTDLWRSADREPDENKEKCEREKHERENSHAQDTTTMDANTTKQVKFEDTQVNLNDDFKPKTDYQSEIRHENEQKGETEECLNNGSAQHHVGKGSGYVPQSKHKHKENNQKDGGENEAHKSNEIHKKSDEKSKDMTFKEEGEGQAGASEASRYLDSRGADESEESKPKHDDIIIYNKIYKGQKEHNENVWTDMRDKNDGVNQSKLDEKQESMRKLSMTNPLDLKNGKTESEAKGEQKYYGLKTHTKSQENKEDPENLDRQSGSGRKESLKENQAADGDKKANQRKSQANTTEGVKSSADGQHKLLKYKVIEEISGSSIGNEIKTIIISEGSIKRKEGNNTEQHITEEQRHLTLDERKHTTRANRRQHKNPRKTKHSKNFSLKEMPNTLLDIAKTDDSFKRRRLPKFKWLNLLRKMNQHTKKKKKKDQLCFVCPFRPTNVQIMSQSQNKKVMRLAELWWFSLLGTMHFIVMKNSLCTQCNKREAWFGNMGFRFWISPHAKFSMSALKKKKTWVYISFRDFMRGQMTLINY